jgi:hypothetical protein
MVCVHTCSPMISLRYLANMLLNMLWHELSQQGSCTLLVVLWTVCFYSLGNWELKRHISLLSQIFIWLSKHHCFWEKNISDSHRNQGIIFMKFSKAKIKDIYLNYHGTVVQINLHKSRRCWDIHTFIIFGVCRKNLDHSTIVEISLSK